MEVSITTMSRNGQIVIPTDVRKALGIKAYEKFLVIGEGNTILIRRLNREALKEEFDRLMSSFGSSFESSGISGEDVQNEIKGYRLSKSGKDEDSA